MSFARRLSPAMRLHLFRCVSLFLADPLQVPHLLTACGCQRSQCALDDFHRGCAWLWQRAWNARAAEAATRTARAAGACLPLGVLLIVEILPVRLQPHSETRAVESAGLLTCAPVLAGPRLQLGLPTDWSEAPGA